MTSILNRGAALWDPPEERKAVLLSIPASISLADLDGLLRGYNAALGLSNGGVMALAIADMPAGTARGGQITFEFTLSIKD